MSKPTFVEQLLALNNEQILEGASTEQLLQLAARLPKLTQQVHIQVNGERSESRRSDRPSSRQGSRRPSQSLFFGNSATSPRPAISPRPKTPMQLVKERLSRCTTPTVTPRGQRGRSTFDFTHKEHTPSKTAVAPVHSGSTSKNNHQLILAHQEHVPSNAPEPEGEAHDDFKQMGDADRAYMAQFKKKIEKFCHGGIAGLERIFRRFDTNRDGMIEEDELKDGLAAIGMRIRDVEAKRIIYILDRDQSGVVSYDEFLRELRGCLNERRLALIKVAFEVFDTDGSGQVDAKDIHAAYDASKHPEVISGKKTAEEVIATFIDQFEKYGNHDGVVTLKEFVEYYRFVSASIDDDDYFELMIRNAWHISGGKGVAENTSCLRVLVTHTDGSEEVVEIQNDIGLGTHPTQGELKRRLKRQGCTAVDCVKLHM